MESLRVFEASARHGNFTRAAEELGVTPTAVSLRIRELEAELGQSLFVRNGPRIALTEAGSRLAGRMAEVMRLTRSAVAECKTAGVTLRITATPTFAAHWLAPRLAAYHTLVPATRIRLDVSTEIRQPDQFDVAIRSGFGDWPDMQMVPLLSVLGTPMLSSALAQRYAVRTPADLQNVPLLPDVNWKSWFRQVGIADPVLHLTSTMMMTQDMTAAAAVGGAGVALLSPVLFGSLVAEGKLVRPFEPTFVGPETYYALRHQQDDRPEPAHFVDWLCDAIATSQSVGIRA
jgi:LysR family transcriptional regulator, glycine cleavage system transcriptional activator